MYPHTRTIVTGAAGLLKRGLCDTNLTVSMFPQSKSSLGGRNNGHEKRQNMSRQMHRFKVLIQVYSNQLFLKSLLKNKSINMFSL